LPLAHLSDAIVSTHSVFHCLGIRMDVLSLDQKRSNSSKSPIPMGLCFFLDLVVDVLADSLIKIKVINCQILFLSLKQIFRRTFSSIIIIHANP
jgi:hypothetical protein